jgi:hypothetical protein
MGLFYGEWAPHGYEKIADKFWVSYQDQKPVQTLPKALILITNDTLDCKNDMQNRL